MKKKKGSIPKILLWLSLPLNITTTPKKFGVTSHGEKSAIYPNTHRKISEIVVHGSRGNNRGTHKLAWTLKVVKKN